MTARDRLASIERKRAQLLDAVAAMPPALLTAHPRPGKWSIQEIVEHLVVAEPAVFGDLDALRQVAPLRRGVKHRIRYWVVMFILRYDIPVQVPSRALLPTGERTLNQLREAWEANHRLLREWLTHPVPAQVDMPLFRHPVAGPMTAVESLRMLEVHLDRHIRQVGTLSRTVRVDSRAH